MKKKTKIICTMGPNTEDPAVMRRLMEEGMDVARFNFSHGTHEEHKVKLDQLKKLREEMDLPVAALLDTKGPEIRTGLLEDGAPVTLLTGEEYTLTTKPVIGNGKIGHITYGGLPEDVEPGNFILIDDGLIQLVVKEATDTDIICTVKNGGQLGQQKGVNVPGVKVRLPDITEQDQDDIAFGIEQGFDFIAASFVRNANCIRSIRRILNAFDSKIQIIAKIENREGVDNIDEILDVCDGVMVARGDMGVEIPPEEVPYIQKEIIRKCNEASKPVITATQMLDSMMRNPRPTRAEVADVANAIYDGTDVIMLSGETAVGKYPVEAVQMMAQIARTTEAHLDHEAYRQRKLSRHKASVTNVVCYSSVSAATQLETKVILAPTMSGYTARMLSKWRPAVTILGMTPNDRVLRQLQLLWGVKPVRIQWESSTEDLIPACLREAREHGYVTSGERVVVTAGVVNEPKEQIRGVGSTNMMRILEVD